MDAPPYPFLLIDLFCSLRLGRMCIYIYILTLFFWALGQTVSNLCFDVLHFIFFYSSAVAMSYKLNEANVFLMKILFHVCSIFSLSNVSYHD